MRVSKVCHRRWGGGGILIFFVPSFFGHSRLEAIRAGFRIRRIGDIASRIRLRICPVNIATFRRDIIDRAFANLRNIPAAAYCRIQARHKIWHSSQVVIYFRASDVRDR